MPPRNPTAKAPGSHRKQKDSPVLSLIQPPKFPHNSLEHLIHLQIFLCFPFPKSSPKVDLSSLSRRHPHELSSFPRRKILEETPTSLGTCEIVSSPLIHWLNELVRLSRVNMLVPLLWMIVLVLIIQRHEVCRSEMFHRRCPFLAINIRMLRIKSPKLLCKAHDILVGPVLASNENVSSPREIESK